MLLGSFRRASRVGAGLYVWNYGDEVPSSIGTHTEDASHGGVDMMGLEVVRANRVVLDAVATPLGAPLPGLGADVMARFAKSFTSRLGAGSHLADDLDGDAASPVNKRDGACDGWVALTASDRRVYDKCYAITFRVEGNTQPNLGLAAHTALIVNTSRLPAPPVVVPPPPPPVVVPPPGPPVCRASAKCCEPAPNGGCYQCVPRSASCQ